VCESIKQFFFIKSVIFICVVFNFAFAQDKSYPVPVCNAKQLFFLQRTTNTNTIVCELNYKSGGVDKDDPIHVYWIKYQDKGQNEELNYIQRKFADGIDAKEIGLNKYELNFVSYKKYKMYLMVGADTQYHVYTTINKKLVLLIRIFLQIKGGSFWSPNIEYVELTGLDPVINLQVKERLEI